LSRALLLLLALFAPAPRLAPADVAPPDPAPVVVDLAQASWLRNGVAPAQPPVVSDATVQLPFDAAGERWSCEFRTEAAQTRRLGLRWVGAPDGLLVEVVLDGARLSPPRDAWRPTSRVLHSDLGSQWLGGGAHLLELVAREQPPEGVGQLRLVALELGAP
jgi:hypothetical protein